jgi:hypothetical protein
MSTVRTNLMFTFSAQKSRNGISGLQISKISRGHAPRPPSYARSLNMLRSDFWLDPPLGLIYKSARHDDITKVSIRTTTGAVRCKCDEMWVYRLRKKLKFFAGFESSV